MSDKVSMLVTELNVQVFLNCRRNSRIRDVDHVRFNPLSHTAPSSAIDLSYLCLFSELKGWTKEELEKLGLPTEAPSVPSSDTMDAESEAVPADSSAKETIDATVNIASGVHAGTIVVNTHSSKATGLIYGHEHSSFVDVKGKLSVTSWEILKSQRNSVHAHSSGGQVTIHFVVEDATVAVFKAVGGGIGKGLKGWVEWSA